MPHFSVLLPQTSAHPSSHPSSHLYVRSSFIASENNDDDEECRPTVARRRINLHPMKAQRASLAAAMMEHRTHGTSTFIILLAGKLLASGRRRLAYAAFHRRNVAAALTQRASGQASAPTDDRQQVLRSDGRPKGGSADRRTSANYTDHRRPTGLIRRPSTGSTHRPSTGLTDDSGDRRIDRRSDRKTGMLTDR